jgi:hypothetical protein
MKEPNEKTFKTEEEKLQRLYKIANALSIASFAAAPIVIGYYAIVLFVI